MKHFIFFIRLNTCFFALVCFSSVGYASSEADNVHFCLPFESEDKRDSQYVARKQALNLNVGEPRTVRLIYFLPNDRSFNEEVVQNMKDEIRNIQTFYAEQMQAHEYGNKTFRFETDAQGEPMVHRVDGQHPLGHYLRHKFHRVEGELEQTFNLDENIYFVVIDYSGPVWGVMGTGGRKGKNGGVAVFLQGFSWRTAAHELGHAFGLAHDFNSDAYMMSYGLRRDRLSAGNAEYLTVHPYFKSDTSSSTGAGAQGAEPTIELISPTEYPVGSNSVSVQLKLNDVEGLHQVILFAYTTEPHPAAGFQEMKAYRRLEGEKDAVVEFEYDGVIPSLSYTKLSDSYEHRIRVMVVDIDGNVRDVFLSLSEISPYHHIATLEGHTAIVNSIAFSPDETIFASGAGDGTIRLWDVATGKHITTLEDSDKGYPVRSIAFSPDGTVLASQSDDHRVRLWDVSTRGNIATFKLPYVYSLFFTPDGTLLAASAALDGTARINNTLRLRDVLTGENIATLEGHTDLISSVVFSPDGTLLASGSGDKTVRLWDVSTGENIATLEGHWSQVNSVAFSPDGMVLASGGYSDGVVNLWDVSTRTNIATLGGDIEGIHSVVFSPDGTTIAVAFNNNTIKLWNVSTRTTITRFYEESLIRAIAFSPDGARLTTGSWHGEINLWDTSEWIRFPRPQTLEKISGDNQQGTFRAVLANPYVVEVRDQYGNPLPGAQVTFTVAAGDGKLRGQFTVESVTTDANGRAQSTFSLGSNAGTNTVKASIGEIEVIFNATGIETSITPVIGGAYQKWRLPNGAIARLGKGSIGGGDRVVAFSLDGHFAVASDIGIWLYDVATSRELALLTGHTDGVNVVAFSPDGIAIASGSADRTVKFWDVATGENIATLEGHRGGVNTVAFSPDGKMLASGAWDNTVRLWDVETRTNIATFEGHTDRVNSVALSPDETILATASGDGKVRLWDVETRENIATYRYVTVNSIAFSPDGSTFAVGTNDQVNLWDVSTQKNIATLEGHTGAGSVAFSSDGTTLAMRSIDGTVTLWEIATQNISILKGHKQRINSVAFSPNGTILASGSEGVVELWDVVTRSHIATVDDGGWERERRGFGLGSINTVAFSPDGTTLAGAGTDVYLWDVLTRTYIGILEGRGTIRSVAFSPDGTTLAFGFPDGAVKLWDVSTQTNIATLEGHTGWVRSVAFSPDGTLASGSDDRTVRLWDVSTQTNIATLEGHTDNVISIAFSPDGTTIASGSYDKTVKLWDVSTEKNIATLEGHTGWIESVSFSPDGTVLASAGSGQIRLWDIATKTDIGTLEGHNRINSIAFSPDGTALVSGSADGTALLWDMSAYVTPVVDGGSGGPDRSSTADFDGNGTVGVSDFLLFSAQFGLSRGDAGYDARFDLDGDGMIGISDFLIFVNAFGK